ncbi:hypothetical protein JQ621_08960 [Bradyrhizobium manausense]|nr:hypothetical protein [Bradyrhizobium manausense]
MERQFEIIGEALNRLSKDAPDIAGRVPDLRKIVSFRNLLIHGYALSTTDESGRSSHPCCPLCAPPSQLS